MASSESIQNSLVTSATNSTGNRGSRAWEWLRLTRIDAFCFLAIVIWFGAFCTSVVAWCDDFLDSASHLHAIMNCGYAIAAAAGILLAFWRLSFGRIIPIAAIFGIGILIHFYSAGWLMEEPVFDRASRLDVTGAGWLFSSIRIYSGSLLIVLLASCLLAYLVRLASKFFSFSKRWIRIPKISRTRLLIGAAILLLILGTFQNILTFNNGGKMPELFLNNSPIDSRSGSKLMALVLGTLLNAAIALGFLVPVVRIAVSKWTVQKRILILSAIGLAVLSVGAVIGTVNKLFDWYPQRLSYYLGISMCVPVFLLGLICLVTPRSLKQQISNGRSARHWPGIWPIGLALALIIGCGIFANRYDVNALLNTRTRDFGTALKFAKTSAGVKQKSGGGIQLDPSQGQNVWVVRIRDKRDKNALGYPFDISLGTQLLIHNLQPFVDVSLLKTPIGARGQASRLHYISLAGGAPTSKQLKDLASHVPSLVIGDDVELPAKCTAGDELTKWTGFYLGKEYRPLAPFLLSHLNVPGQQVSIQSELKREDWDAILEVSQNRPVMILDTSDFSELFKLAKTDQRQWNNISIQHNLYLKENTEQLRELLAIASKKEFNLNLFGPLEEKTKWAIAFQMKGKGPSPDILALENFAEYSKKTVNKLAPASSAGSPQYYLLSAREFGWVFEESRGSPVGIWLPDSNLVPAMKSQFRKLKTLRLDVREITGVMATGSVLAEAKDLDSLPALENLYLPTGVQFTDLDFFHRLPKLKRLQIQAQDRSLHHSDLGFEQCRNLQELILFGTPDAQTTRELATLEKLETIHLVDDQLDYVTEDSRARLAKSLSNVEVVFIKREDFTPFVSDAWREHVAKLRKSIIDDIEAGLENLHPNR